MFRELQIGVSLSVLLVLWYSVIFSTQYNVLVLRAVRWNAPTETIQGSMASSKLYGGLDCGQPAWLGWATGQGRPVFE